jgi:hypothetical protein
MLNLAIMYIYQYLLNQYCYYSNALDFLWAFFSTPGYDKSADQLYVAPNTITFLNELKDQQTQDYLLPVTVSYNTKSSPDNWIQLTNIDSGSWADVSIPDDAATLGVAYEVDGQWYSACHVAITTKVRAQLAGSPLHTAIQAAWRAPGGNGSCLILNEK